MKSISIQSRLIATAVGIALILVALGIAVQYYMNNSFGYYNMLTNVKNLLNNELSMRKVEKEFLQQETINPDFFLTGRSHLVSKFDSLYQEVNSTIRELQSNNIKGNSLYINELNDIQSNFQSYHNDFLDLVALIKEKGFKDHGIIGKMREQIHHVEDIADRTNNLLYSKHMLMLRRHEKDYLLRKDLKYQEKFNDRVAVFIARLEQDGNYRGHDLIESIQVYQKLFNKVIAQDQRIGLSNNNGLLAELDKQTRKIEKDLARLHGSIYNQTKEKISHAITTLLAVTLLLSLGILFILFRTSRYIVSSINSLRNYIMGLGKGKLPDVIQNSNQDEIGQMVESVNILTRNLKNTRDFAIEVGKGNFETDIDVFDNQGELGGNLVEMRNRLHEVAQVQKKEKEAAEIRNWVNTGMAKFSELLRKDFDNLEDLGFELVKELVHYVNANQAGIFMLDEEGHDNICYDLVATYAYNRKKFSDQRVKLGEGLVGTCAIEKETIYMTDIPQDYINITSGLGGANPNSLLIVPLKREEEVPGIIEIASFKELPGYMIEFIEKISENIASTLSNLKINHRTNALLEKTQMQAEELAAQEEEMRQNMEELQATQEAMQKREQELMDEISMLKEGKEKQTGNLKLLEEKLQQKDQEFMGVLQAIDHAAIMLEYDLNGQLIFANNKFYATMEQEKDEAGPINIMDLIPEHEKENFILVWNKACLGHPREYTLEKTTKSGKNIWIWISLSPIQNAEGKVQKIIYLGIDITDQKQKELSIQRQLQVAEEELRQNMEEYSRVHKILVEENKKMNQYFEKPFKSKA